MTGIVPVKAQEAAMFVVEHDCDRRCRSELDLEGVQIRYTLGMMLRATRRAHDNAHAVEPPAPVYITPDGVLVRSGIP